MLLHKQEVIEWLVRNGDLATAFEVEGSLPEQVDTHQDRELLAKYGIDIKSLLEQR